jgi:aspartate aminotransferase
MRNVTTEIMCDVHKRIELAKQIGEIKRKKGILVKDEKVEQEMRIMVMKLAHELGLSNEFSLRLLNLLLCESESVQELKQLPKIQKQTHLGIFMRAKQLEATGRKIIHMEVGEPDYPPPASVGTAMSESFRLKYYHYTDTRGIPALRDAVAKKEEVKEEQVLITPGGRFAVFAAITSLLKAGQEMIIIEPAWPAYKECADFIGASTKVLRTTIEENWTPDLKQLEFMINPATKMIVINYPNNPTGKVIDIKTVEKIVSIAKDNDLYLLSDEVYADYTFKEFNSILKYNYEKSILVGSISKRYAMTGFRVGYGIASKDLISKMARVQAVAITSVAEPMQQAALVAIREDPIENIATMRSRLEFITSKLKHMPVKFSQPEGAMYVYPQLSQNEEDIPFVERMLDSGVAIAPGSGFGDSYTRFVRISACQPVPVLEKGLDIMASMFNSRKI